MSAAVVEAVRAEAERAAAVEADKAAAFAEEARAAVELIEAVVRAAKPALWALAEPTRFFAEEPQPAVFLLGGESGSTAVRRQLYLTPETQFIEDVREYRGGAWVLSEVRGVPIAQVDARYGAEKVAARLLRLCAGVASGNAGRRAAEARARAERLRALAVLAGALGGRS